MGRGGVGGCTVVGGMVEILWVSETTLLGSNGSREWWAQTKWGMGGEIETVERGRKRGGGAGRAGWWWVVMREGGGHPYSSTCTLSWDRLGLEKLGQDRRTEV
jgi:hypothetical protein